MTSNQVRLLVFFEKGGGMHVIRRTLDSIYNICGLIAAFFMVLILVTIVVQMVARWTQTTVPGASDYAGYFMAGASFFALTYALNHGAHVRVTLFLTKLGDKRRWGETWCFGIATILAIFFAINAIEGTWLSYKLNDISQGQDATPLWIPQLSMSIGTLVLAIGLTDHLIRIVFTGATEFIESSLGEDDTE